MGQSGWVGKMSTPPGFEPQTLVMVYDQIPPEQELRTYIQTDGNDIRPHTAQTNNEHTSTESNLVTAQSTDREPREDGHI